MTKRIILAALIFVLSFSLFSCQKEEITDDASQNENEIVQGHGDLVYTEQNFTNNDYCDIFIGKIVSKEAIAETVEFMSFKNNMSYEQTLYTVEVEKTYLPFVVTEDSTISVVGAYAKAQNLYSNKLEVGEKYILSGVVQAYNGEPVIVLINNMTAKISDDGVLTPESTTAEEMYAGIDTIEELEADPGFTELCNSVDTGYLSPEFYSEEDEETTVNSSEQPKPTKEQVIENIRKALKVDSELEMNIDYNNFPDTDTE